MSEEKQKVVHALSVVLADSYTLYLKTQNFHWNVTGPKFVELHGLFEQHYTELAVAIDEIAERIRALGAFAPGSYSEYVKLANIKEAEGRYTATEMVESLTADLETMASSAKAVISAATAAGDDVSTDIGVQRAAIHEKQAWMLRAIAGE